MNYISTIRQPITTELETFKIVFDKALTHDDGLLSQALEHIRNRGGKFMRPILILLMAKAFGKVTDVAQYAAVGLELLHTASLVHDDVVDESGERRGQASVNATYNNKVAVLVGDFILSTSLLNIAKTGETEIVTELAELGRTLSNGEILQLTNIQRTDISEEIYYRVIEQKTAVLFEACAVMGAKAAGADKDIVEEARLFGRNIGLIFQIRDDIFDYFNDDTIGKPTGNDMAEGKLTLPVIYAVNHANNDEMYRLALKVRQKTVTKDEIQRLVAFTIETGGIAYAERRMNEIHQETLRFIEQRIKNQEVADALKAYLDYVIVRSK